jgi:hypothetical protein
MTNIPPFNICSWVADLILDVKPSFRECEKVEDETVLPMHPGNDNHVHSITANYM